MNWISVDKQLPIKTSAYLVANSVGGVWIGFWIGQKWLDDDGESLDLDDSWVTRWQEILDAPSQPPKEID